MSKKIFAVFVVLLASFVLFAQAAEERNAQRIGIISAMDNEIDLLLRNADIKIVETVGGRDYHVGTLCGKDVVIVRAGIGKVYSSAGTTAMLCNYNISKVIFTGIAGGVGDDTSVLDVVVGTDLVQHDYGMVRDDGFIWTSEYAEEKEGRIDCDAELVDKAFRASVEVIGADHTFKGTIATGDQFIASSDYVKTLQDRFNAMACEMEGCSVGAICNLYSVPFVIIRTMSDKADGLAHETYENMGDIAADNSCRIVMRMLEEL